MISKFKITMTCAALALTLVGCGGGNTEPPPETSQPADSLGGRITALENSGLLPRLDRSDGLLGSDSDGNGIRDDIDRYIDSLGVQPKNKAAARQLARANQAVMVLVQAGQLGNAMKVKEVNQLGTRAINCLFDRMDSRTPEGWKISRALESMTYNTKSRAIAYAKFNQALSGTTWALPDGDTCEE